MKSKFLILVFVCLGISHMSAMSSKKEARQPEDNPLLSVASEGDQDFNQYDYIAEPSQSASASRESRVGKKPLYRYQSCGETKEAAAKRMVCEALKAMAIANPDAASIEGVYNYHWPHAKLPPYRRLSITNFSDILMTAEGDVKELEFVAYQKAIQWHIEHGGNEYAPKGIKKHINRIAMATWLVVAWFL